MKAIGNAILVVTLVSGLARAADSATDNTTKSQPNKQRVEKTSKAGAAKERKPGQEPNANASGTARDEGTRKKGFKKEAKDINRPLPETRPDVAPAPAIR